MQSSTMHIRDREVAVYVRWLKFIFKKDGTEGTQNTSSTNYNSTTSTMQREELPKFWGDRVGLWGWLGVVLYPTWGVARPSDYGCW